MPAIIGLKKVHLAACDALRPEPVALAERLYGFQMHGEWETFREVLPDYAEALGEEGLAAYRARVEEAWRALPRLGPKDLRGQWSMGRFNVESAMEDIARHVGDVELLLALREKNLSSPVRFMDLAKTLRDCGRADEALRWVGQGIEAFPGERLDDLLSLAIELELDLGNSEAAEQYAWQRFERSAGCEGFVRLLTVAETIGRSAALRARALDYLWQQVADDESPAGITRRSRWQKPKRGKLVSIFLREGDAEAMWKAFCGGEVAAELWAQVAEVRGKSHHEDAIAVYRRLLPVLVESGSQGSHYEAAFSVVKKIRALRKGYGQLGIFNDELAEIRLEWKRKRIFMKLLDAL
jgi:tetratricopeptide (TPR) repeat protein